MMSIKRYIYGNKSIIALVLLPIISLAVYAATCSNPGSSTQSVFSVTDPNGKIEVPSGGCNVQFWNVSSLNVKAANLTLPHTDKASDDCKGYGTNTGQPIVASNTIVTAPTIYGPFRPELMIGTVSNTYEKSGNKTTFDMAAGNYNEIEVRNGGALNILGSSTIKALKCNSDGGITFSPGTYYIQQMYHQARCNINVQRDNNNIPIGKVVLHFNTETSIDGGKTCVNLDKDGCSGNPQGKDEMARQYPDMLQIVVHNGKFKTQGNVHIAAGVLVEKDIADFSNGSPTTIIGEVIATGIKTQNNNSSIFYYKSTAGNNSGPVKGFSTISPPAVPPVIKSGRDLAFIGAQKLEDDGSISGHLSAYKLDAKAQLAALASWDVANTMSAADRRSLFQTNLETTTKSTFTKINDASVAVTALGLTAPDSTRSNKELIFDPNAYSGAYLNGRSATSLLGRPWRTAPVIARTEDDKTNLVLFAADDGVLYAVNGTTGALVWGWVPKDILPLTAKPGDLMKIHPWGQINYIQKDGVGYVVGTALSGALHFSIKLDVDGKLDSIVWYDYVANGLSPTDGKDVPLIGSSKEKTDNQVGAAPGGEAPVQAITQDASTKGMVAYIRNNQIYIRLVDTADTPVVNGPLVSETFEVDVPSITAGVPPTKVSVTATPSTNLIFVNKNKMAFGDSYGQVKWFDPFVFDADTKQVAFKAKQAVTKSSSKLLGLTATTTLIASGTQMTLLAYDKENVNMVKWLTGGGFTMGWHIGLDYSDTGLPKLPAGAVLSAIVHVSRENLYIPFTIPPSDVSATCAPEGYAMGPLDINLGQIKTDKTYLFNDKSIADTTNYISKFGQGEMQALRSTRTSGAGARGYTTGVSNYGGDQASKGWGVFDEGALGGPLKRILWRELTNY